MHNLPGRHSDEPGPCQSRTDQRIEIIGAKPGWNAHRSSHCAVLEAPFRHAWYIAEGQAVLLDQVVRRPRLAAPAQIIRRGAVPLGDRFDRRRLILIQLAALALLKS